ncbi:MAG TPA: hypothetical protein ENH55_14695 [Aurantimonas coralicida]|uniref:Uncharacterized protein n=2 Tax=root TaxID=1 RepID=A0A9C9NK16_9HYPH|nr:hypothetical protein [Aurantimonas sp. A3-2-R12]HDZ73975.1 hypothetical protein [Aurantimonas coralicida]HEU02770.1 hypothetical protein [Aurantimonas coralicida]
MKFLVLATAAAIGFAAPAFAFQCPADIATIDQALATKPVSDADRAKVNALRQEGARLHAAGSHAQSVQKLAQAKQILGVR